MPMCIIELIVIILILKNNCGAFLFQNAVQGELVDVLKEELKDAENAAGLAADLEWLRLAKNHQGLLSKLQHLQRPRQLLLLRLRDTLLQHQKLVPLLVLALRQDEDPGEMHLKKDEVASQGNWRSILMKICNFWIRSTKEASMEQQLI